MSRFMERLHPNVKPNKQVLHPGHQPYPLSSGRKYFASSSGRTYASGEALTNRLDQFRAVLSMSVHSAV